MLQNGLVGRQIIRYLRNVLSHLPSSVLIRVLTRYFFDIQSKLGHMLGNELPIAPCRHHRLHLRLQRQSVLPRRQINIIRIPLLIRQDLVSPAAVAVRERIAFQFLKRDFSVDADALERTELLLLVQIVEAQLIQALPLHTEGIADLIARLGP